MRSENTGNVITAIKFNKDKVIILFGKSKKIEICEETYTSSYFYVGKKFSDNDLVKIERDNQVGLAVRYAKTILSARLISEWNMRNKLYEKGYEKEIVDLAIAKLKKEKLINDKALCKELIAYYNEKLFGRLRIVKELRLKGIFDETIQELKFPEAIELKKARALLPKLLQQYDHLNYGEKKQHIYNALIRNGFDNEVALEVTKKVKAGPARDESNKLRRDFAIAVDEGMKKYKTEDGVKAYVFRSLSHKGYKLMDIKVLWENR